MANRTPPHITSASWSANTAQVGDKVTLTAITSGIKDGTQVSFEISEYSGRTPKQGGGGDETPITTLTAKVQSDRAEVKWTVVLVSEKAKSGNLPEYRFRAKRGTEAGVVSKLLKLGDVTAVKWIDPGTNESRAVGVKDTQAYFKNTDSVTLRVEARGLDGFDVKFVVSVRNMLGGSAGWRPLPNSLRATIASGKAETSFRLTQDQLDHYGFGTFQFEIQLSSKGVTVTPKKNRSGLARQYATRLGIWGFGPSESDNMSNHRVIEIAQNLHGIAIAWGSSRKMARLAAQIAPEETDFKVFGYSLGGASAAELTREIANRKIPVKALYGIDPVSVGRSTIKIGGTVQTAYCYYQRNGARLILMKNSLGKGDPYVFPDGTEIPNGREVFYYPGTEKKKVYHEDMPDYVQKPENVTVTVLDAMR